LPRFFAEKARSTIDLATVDLPETIRAVQKKVGVDDDGTPGPETWVAIYNRLYPEAAPRSRGVSAAELASPPSMLSDRVDDRSEKVIATLLPEVQPYARALVRKAAQHGITIKVLSGLRTYEEQNDLFAQGRTKSGRIVTKARGGFSNHNFGIAFDIGVFEGTKYLDDSPKYKAVGVLGMDLGLEWGGNWKTIVDEPHFQLRPKWAGDMKESVMLAELRVRKDFRKGAYA
jgi:peptidoglycan L-alanyl-D-glutamate endopeptidase CwlK